MKIMSKSYEDKNITNAPKHPKFTINTAMGTMNQKKYSPGDSVAEYKNLEEANTIITGDEIKQQNENL